jgi:hypothetical protein
MTTTKEVKILFHTLVKIMYKKDKDKKEEINPVYHVDEIIKSILKIKKVDRFKNLQHDKFCFLESSIEVKIDEDVKLIAALFKSARNEFRPNIINKRTGEERKNPKSLADGDIEKTHVVIKIDKISNEVYLFIEYNHTGVTVNNIVNYFKDFNKKYIEAQGKKINYLLCDQTITRNDFLTELERLSSSKIAEVYFDKKLLGGKALNFSNKTVGLKKDLKLVAASNIGDDITELAVDLFNKFKKGESDISKVRIIGRDSNNNDVILDTSFMGKKEYVTIEINSDTGDLNTTQMFTNLKNIALEF